MKVYAVLLSVLCTTALIPAMEVAPQSTSVKDTEAVSSLDGITPADAAVACSMLGLSYWMNYKCKGFIKDLPSSRNPAGGVLARYIPLLNSNTYMPTIAREMICAGAFATLTLGLKTVIADNLLSTGAEIGGDGKAVKGASPAWFEKVWATGLSLAFAKLAYDMYHASIVPDAFISLKKLIKAAPKVSAVKPA